MNPQWNEGEGFGGSQAALKEAASSARYIAGGPALASPCDSVSGLVF